MVKFVFFLFLISMYSYGYMHTKSSRGENIKWKKRNSQILLYLNNNSSNFTAAEVNAIVNSSIYQWNQTTNQSIVTTTSSVSNTDGSIQFTNDPRYFSNGVIAVTKTLFQESSGVIYDASIYVNESFSQQSLLTNDKSLSSNGFAYLGDVMTHELGHLLGLSHSEVYNSSMVFSIFKNQHEIESDDIKGIQDLYGAANSNKKIIGKVIGGDRIGVFGVHVQLISLKDNNIIAGVFTDTKGRFEFSGLSEGDQYILYMDKIKSVKNLDSSLDKSTSRYCSNASFKPSFLSSCDSSKKGESSILRFKNKSILDVGEFTIRCSSQVKSRYLLSKSNSENYDFDMSKGRFTHTGYFSSDEINSVVGSVDKFYVDLRSIPLSSFNDNKLRINFMSNKLGSAFLANIKIKNIETNTELQKSYTFDVNTGKINSEIIFEINLSSNENENHFEISIAPQAMTSSQKEAVFAVSSLLTNSINLYHITVQTLVNDAPIFLEDFYQDNSSCDEGDVPYVLTENLSGGDTSGSSQAMSCGTINTSNKGSSNLFSMMLGFILIFASVNLKNLSLNILSK